MKKALKSACSNKNRFA